jgi:hypothetical protein
MKESGFVPHTQARINTDLAWGTKINIRNWSVDYLQKIVYKIEL